MKGIVRRTLHVLMTKAERILCSMSLYVSCNYTIKGARLFRFFVLFVIFKKPLGSQFAAIYGNLVSF